MLTQNQIIKRLRAGDGTKRYLIATIPCPVQGILYTVDVAAPISYAADPNLKIYAFNNPKAAVKFVQTEVDSDFTWTDRASIVQDAPDIITDLLGNYIICAGTANYTGWIYPARLGIYASPEGGDTGKGYHTAICKQGYSGALPSGFVTVVVVYPTGSSLFSTYESGMTTGVEVYKCNHCGYVGSDFGANHTCPKCYGTRICSTCDYTGIHTACPHCKTSTTLRAVSSTKLYDLYAPISVSVQLLEP